MKTPMTLWRLECESEFVVTAVKVKDTTSKREATKWANQPNQVVSLHREEKELNANYLQTLDL